MSKLRNFFGSIENNSGGAVQFRNKADDTNTLLLPDSTETPILKLSDDIFNTANQLIIGAAGGFGNFVFRDGDGIVIPENIVLRRYDRLVSLFKQPPNVIGVEREDIIGMLWADIAYFNVTAPTTNNTETFDQLINESFNLEKGIYLLELSYGWNHDAIVTSIEARLSFDGNVLGDPFSNGVTHRQEPKKSDGTGGSSGTDQQHSFSGRYQAVITSAGSKSLIFDFRTDNAGDKSTIWDLIVTIKKRTL